MTILTPMLAYTLTLVTTHTGMLLMAVKLDAPTALEWSTSAA